MLVRVTRLIPFLKGFRKLRGPGSRRSHDRIARVQPLVIPVRDLWLLRAATDAGDADSERPGLSTWEVTVGGMMGGTGNWVLLWSLLAVVLMVTGGIVVALVLARRRSDDPPEVRADDSPAVQEAKDALRLRYANGEIGREEYLQGKVELED